MNAALVAVLGDSYPACILYMHPATNLGNGHLYGLLFASTQEDIRIGRLAE